MVKGLEYKSYEELLKEPGGEEARGVLIILYNSPERGCVQVSYISQDCEEIPEFLGQKYGHMAKRLDLSFNLLRRLNIVEGVVLIEYHVAELGKRLSPEPLAEGSVCVHIV
ncbi:hypothetical protein BTVI_47018 [Pitangus sulphuratus]|nr:hypothetical protein BTVI_47018 [Pitangus sulphuratus]